MPNPSELQRDAEPAPPPTCPTHGVPWVRLAYAAAWHCPECLGLERDDAIAERDRLRAVIAQHDLCHDLHGRVDARAFADGCAAEQRKLYGCAPDADEVTRLRADLAAANKRADNWQEYAGSLRCQKCRHPWGPIAKPRGIEEDGYQCVWVCPCDCHADVGKLKADLAALAERLAAASHALTKAAEKHGALARATERLRVALAWLRKGERRDRA